MLLLSSPRRPSASFIAAIAKIASDEFARGFQRGINAGWNPRSGEPASLADDASEGTLMAERSTCQPKPNRTMIDGFGREITYVRMSVTDRCNLRCRYCMAEKMTFVPHDEILSLAEIAELVDIFIARGVKRVRLTGGEPLVRKGIGEIVSTLGKRLASGLEELTLTTNGTRLARFARVLRDAGMRRINVSLDSRDADRFHHITRGGDLSQVLMGIAEASRAGLKIKINMVALKGANDGEFHSMLRWCASEGHDLTLIETMPLGDVGHARVEDYLPLTVVHGDLARHFRLIASFVRTGGPARYFDVEGSDTRLGYISPLSNNFCSGCNRIRVAATGTVFGCLAHDQKIELRQMLRSGGRAVVQEALDLLVAGKPQGHEFNIGAGRPSVARHMSVTGG